MKKFILILSIMIIILSINKKEMKEEEMIRFRIIANSNSEVDQATKRKVMKSISKTLLENTPTTKEEEKNYILDKLPTFEEKIKETTDNYIINYGLNYFPKKEYNGKEYKAGEYESLVITLGEGKGDNFWCILYPPLCVLDDEVEYKSFIKEALSKLF
ncbi:MAG: stage II sporulation protein R [Bacilli bacterium]|nr:stage II sporulation protein R [Bacilli bacterium]